jgi:cell division septation protein DedD
VAELGRRAGFRIQWALARGGSNPPFGTKYEYFHNMRELKPKLMIANSGRKRRGPGGGFWSFLTFLIVFIVGVYAGIKIDQMGLIGGVPKEAKRDIAADRNPVKYDAKSTESFVYKHEIPSGEKDIGEGGDGVFTGEKRIAEELTSHEPVLSVTENKADTGLTSIDPGKITGQSGTAENTLTEESVTKPGDATDAVTNSTEQTAKGKYTLQVGAFVDKTDAEKAVNEYRSKGFNAYTVQVENSKGEKWNLVKIGKYGSLEEAWGQSALFKRTEGTDAYVEIVGKKTVFNESWGKNGKNGE